MKDLSALSVPRPQVIKIIFSALCLVHFNQNFNSVIQANDTKKMISYIKRQFAPKIVDKPGFLIDSIKNFDIEKLTKDQYKNAMRCFNCSEVKKVRAKTIHAALPYIWNFVNSTLLDASFNELHSSPITHDPSPKKKRATKKRNTTINSSVSYKTEIKSTDARVSLPQNLSPEKSESLSTYIPESVAPWNEKLRAINGPLVDHLITDSAHYGNVIMTLFASLLIVNTPKKNYRVVLESGDLVKAWELV